MLTGFEIEHTVNGISSVHQVNYLHIANLIAKLNPQMDALALTSLMQKPGGALSASYHLNRSARAHLHHKCAGVGNYEDLNDIDSIIEASMVKVMVAVIQFACRDAVQITISAKANSIINLAGEIQDKHTYDKALPEVQALFLVHEILKREYMLEMISSTPDSELDFDEISNEMYLDYHDFLRLSLEPETELEEILTEKQENLITAVTALQRRKAGEQPTLHLI